MCMVIYKEGTTIPKINNERKKESKTLTATENEKYCGGGKDEESYEQKSYWFV